MELLVATCVFVLAIGYLAWTEGKRYAWGVAIFLVVTAAAYVLIEKYFGRHGALAFSLAALILAVGWRMFFRVKGRTKEK